MIDEPQLLIEHWGQPTSVTTIKPGIISEGASHLPPGLYIEGIFLQADVVNRNRRMYPKPILEKAVNKYIKEQVNSKQALGELNHPPRPNVDPMHAAIIIEEMWWEGNNVHGRARIIEGDNGPGDKLAANIRAGWVPGVSSRGLGRVKDSGKGYNIVQEGFALTVGVDVVWGPSAPDAWVAPKEIRESTTEYPNVVANTADSALKSLMSNLKQYK